MVLEIGTAAPEFTIKAAVSEKEVSHANGRKTVLVFHGNKTQEAPKLVGKAVRAAFPSWQNVLIANIVNLKAFAGLFSKVANAQIKQTYEKMSAKVDPAEEFVVICPDFDNAIGPLFEIPNSDKDCGIVVLDHAGGVIGSHTGLTGIGEAAVAILG
jgi:hypothetical protein